MIPVPACDVFLVKEAARLIFDVKNPLVLIDYPQEKVFSNPALRVEKDVIFLNAYDSSLLSGAIFPRPQNSSGK